MYCYSFTCIMPFPLQRVRRYSQTCSESSPLVKDLTKVLRKYPYYKVAITKIFYTQVYCRSYIIFYP